jgi:hypothetical protein
MSIPWTHCQLPHVVAPRLSTREPWELRGRQQPANEPPHGAYLGSTNPGRAGTPSYSIRPSKASICVARERPAENGGITSTGSGRASAAFGVRADGGHQLGRGDVVQWRYVEQALLLKCGLHLLDQGVESRMEVVAGAHDQLARSRHDAGEPRRAPKWRLNIAVNVA